MLGLIKNEFMKLLLRKKFLITSIVFGLLSILVCVGIILINNMMTPEFQVKTQQSVIDQLEKNKADAKTEKEKAQIDNQITQAQMYLEVAKNKPKEDDPNWKLNIESTIAMLKENMDASPDLSKEKEHYRKQLITYEYLLENNIRPMSDTSPKGLNAFTGLIAFLGSLFVSIIIAIISSDSVSAEYTPPTLKMLLTRPVSRGKVLAAKFITAFISSCGIIIGIQLLATFIMGLIFGFGDPSYPISFGTDYNITTLNAMQGKEAIPVFNSSQVTTLLNFVISSILLQVLYILATTSFFFMLSTLLRSSSISMAISIVTIVAVNILGAIKYTKVVLPFLFTSYGDVTSVIQGTIKEYTLSSLPTPLFSAIILLLWSVVPYIISHLVFTKRDILA